MLEDKITPITLGAGGIMLFKDVPHPNASKVYINWLLAKKAQTKVCKNILLNSRRTDVPPVVKELAVDPAHLNNYYDYTTEENTETGNRFLPVIKAALQK